MNTTMQCNGVELSVLLIIILKKTSLDFNYDRSYLVLLQSNFVT